MGFLDSLFPSAETDPSSGTSPADMQTLALGKALQQIQEVGRQRTAGPMGSIAQNLMPLFGALVQAKAAQAQAVQKGQQDRLNQLLTLAKIGELSRQGGAQGPRNAEQAAVQAQLQGQPTDPWVQLQQQLHPQKPAADTEISLVKKSLQEGPGGQSQTTLNALAKQKQAENVGNLQAQIPPKLDLFKQEQAIKAAQKKPLAKPMEDELVSGVTSIRAIDEAIKGFETTTGAEILAGKITGGIMSPQASRDYAKFFNDLDQSRAGARGFTRAALDRIRQELPDPSLAILSPAKFMAQLRSARRHAYEGLVLRVDTIGHSYDVPDSLKAEIIQREPKKFQVDMATPQQEQDIQDIHEAYPGMSPSEVAEYYGHYGPIRKK